MRPIIAFAANRSSVPCQSPAPRPRCVISVRTNPGATAFTVMLRGPSSIAKRLMGGAFLLPWLKPKLGPDRLMAVGALGQAVAMVLYGFARVPATAILASVG